MVLALGVGMSLAAPGAALAGSPTVTGAGSTWSQIAVDQWRADIATQQGLRINFSGVGSSAGRQFYLISQVDFAVSEIPFLPDEVAKLKASGKTYQYVPIVAGGTALMYNLKDAAGRQIRDLRLSPKTLSAIFTGRVTDWSDPAVTQDMGRQLPKRPIVPVVRSDGSGTSAQFSAFIAKMDPSGWGEFANKEGIPNAATSNFPQFGAAVAQKGSDGVANYIAGGVTGVGSIGYVETGYAVQRGFPVVALKNSSGNYVLPNAANVATALKHATLYKDQTQNLTGVYNAADATAYPMSSYSYMIVPTTGISTEKAEVLAKFMVYFACGGQSKASVLGYSPLPANLVKVVFAAVGRMPGNVKVPALNKDACPNPTLAGSLGEGATEVPQGSSSNATAGGRKDSPGSTSGAGTTAGSGTSGGGSVSAGNATGASSKGSGAGGAGGSSAGAAGGGSASDVTGAGAAVIDPAPGAAAVGESAAAGQYAAMTPTSLQIDPGSGGGNNGAALILLLIVAAPAGLYTVLRKYGPQLARSVRK